MNTRKTFLSVAAATAVLASVAGVAVAKSDPKENDAAADLARAHISLTQAIATAEKSASGRATRAELSTERGQTEFEIEVVSANNAVQEVKIDATSGKVLSMKADNADSPGKDGEDDDGDGEHDKD